AKILDFPEKISIPKTEGNEINNVFQALSYDNPEFFFLGYSSSVEQSGLAAHFIPQYVISKENYDTYMAQVNTVLSQIDSKTQGMSAFEKELYVHDYLASSCEYSDAGKDTKTTIYGALISKQANCEGYARSSQFLLNHIGVKCRVIIGDATNANGATEGHMWNIVTINDKEYNLDVTWDDYKINNVPDDKVSLSHMHMNIPTSEIVGSHKATYEKDYANCLYDDANYYKMSGLYFYDYNSDVKNAIASEIVKQVDRGGKSIELKFANEYSYKTAVSRLFDSKEIYRQIARANLKTSRKISSTQVNYYTQDDKKIIRIFFLF
ncbi:MAG: transglutaminase domain-containing protein, partial [Oscillospiraceae bacterium]